MKTLILTLLATLSISLFGKDVKPTVVQPIDAAKILNGIASLPASKVAVQKIAEYPPAVGGSETVFTYKGVRYTLWIWEQKTSNPTEKSIKWARMYFRNVNTVGNEYLWSICDAHLDGKIDSGIAPKNLEEDETYPSFLSELLSQNKLEIFSIDYTAKTSESVRAQKLAQWQEKYTSTLTLLQGFLNSK